MPELAAAANTTDRMDLLAGQALVLTLLGRLLHEFPDAAWLQSLADDAVFDEIPFGASQPAAVQGLSLLQQWAREHRAQQPRASLEAVRADYTRLFIGPGKIIAPPWESVQLDEERLTFQEETLAVRRWYRRFGLQSERLYAEPDDHVGLELAFLGYLAQQALAAHTEGHTARLTDLLAAERAFLLEHPRRWVPGWCAQVIEHARTDLYRGVAYTTLGVLSELETLLAPTIALEGVR